MQQQEACHTGQNEDIFLHHPGLSFADSHENRENQQTAEYSTDSLVNDRSRLDSEVLATQAIPTNGHVPNDYALRRNEVAQCDWCSPITGSTSRSEDRQSGALSCKQWFSLEQEAGSLPCFPSVLEGVPHIDPASADFPSFHDGMPQVEPTGTNFPSVLEGMSQIDPASADFPNVLDDMSQIDPANADFPGVWDGIGTSQIDSTSADLSSVLDRMPQIDPTSADFPSFLDDMAQIDSTSADFPSILDRVSQIDSTSADFPSFLDGLSQIAPAE